MVCVDEIELAENGSPVQCRSEVLNVRDGISVWNGGMVQCPVVAAWPPIPRGPLGDHVQRGGPTAGRRSDDAEL